MDGNSAVSAYTQAAWAAVGHFPVDTENIELVSQSENISFRVSVRGTENSYVLRLHRPGYNSIEELNSERLWAMALSDAGVIEFDSLETIDGEHYALIDMPDDTEQRYAGMTSWYEGAPLREFMATCSDALQRAQIFHSFGEIAAAFHNQSTSWQTPPGFYRRRLGLDGLLGEDPFWGRFWELPELTDPERSLLLRARTAVRDSLTAYGETSHNFSLIHADFTPDNIIYDGSDLAVIDFDDSAFGWHMYDLASAMVECRFEDDYEALDAALLDGYRRCRTLLARDVDMLPDFLLVRGMAIIGWYLQRPEYAGAAYFERFKKWVIDECQRRGF